MSDNMRLKAVIDGDASGAVKAFQQTSSGATRMGKDVDLAAQTAKRALAAMDAELDKAQREFIDAGKASNQFKVGATEMGAAIGATVGILARGGKAVQEQRREYEALSRFLGTEGARSALTFAESLEDVSNFSDEAVRDAILAGTSLVEAYGLGQAQLEQLVARSADVAQLRGFAIEDVAQRAAAAVRGEGEALEAVGFAINETTVAAYAATKGIDYMSKSTDDATKAQLRLELFLQQSASAAGAAEAAATGTAGAMADLKGFTTDATVALGEFLGPLAPVTSELADLALILPLVGAGFGKFAGGAKGALATLGPLSVATAALFGGGYLLQDVARNGDEAGSNAADSFFGGFVAGATGAIKKVTPGSFGDAFFNDVIRQYRGILEQNQIEDLVIDVGFQIEGDGGDAVIKEIGRTIDEVERIQAQSGQGAMQIIIRMAEEAGFVVDETTGLLERQSHIADETERGLLRLADAAIRSSSAIGNQARISADDYAASMERISFTLVEGARNFEQTGKFAVDSADGVAYWTQRIEEAEQAAIAFVGSAENIGDVLLELGGPGLDVPLRMAENLIQSQEALDSTFAVVAGGTDALGRSSQQAADWIGDLTASTSYLDTALKSGRITQAEYNDVLAAETTIVENNASAQAHLDAIRAQQAPLIAAQTDEYEDYLETLTRLTPEAQQTALAFADQGERAKIATAYSTAYAASLGEIPEDVATEMILSDAQSDPILKGILLDYGLIEEGANGEISVNFPDADTLTETIDRLTNSIVDLGKIIATPTVNLDTTVPDAKLPVLVEDITEVNAMIATPDVNLNDNASGSLISIGNYLTDLDGRHATATVTTVQEVVTRVRNEFVPFLHGGIVEHAQHGRIASGALTEWGEAGSELARFPGGGYGLLLGNGRGYLPAGTAITPHPASMLDMGNGGGGLDVDQLTTALTTALRRALGDSRRSGMNFNAPVYLYPATGDVYNELRAWAIGQGRP